jgi:hypothetical protein
MKKELEKDLSRLEAMRAAPKREGPEAASFDAAVAEVIAIHQGFASQGELTETQYSNIRSRIESAHLAYEKLDTPA